MIMAFINSTIKLLVCFSLLLVLAGGTARAQDPDQAALIQKLIQSVENLKGATFIRNGEEHDAGDAADHLRLKLGMAGGRIKNADDFIRLCASRSSVSGEPYLIRLPDGATIEAEKFFREKLKEFNAAQK